MNITSTPALNTARSIEEMGNLLKNMTAQSMELQNKVMKADVTEQVMNQPGLGENIDVCA